jgi:hypothetical protein
MGVNCVAHLIDFIKFVHNFPAHNLMADKPDSGPKDSAKTMHCRDAEKSLG